MLKILRDFPKSLNEILREKVALPKNYKDINKVIVSGMGGSAIVGDIFYDCFNEKLKIPFFVSRGYELPAFADEKTLLICISYSGNTAETLEQLKVGIKKKCKIVGISSNGKLIEILSKRKLPFIKVKGGIPPRTAIGYLLGSLINIFKSLGLIKLKKIKIENPENQAKEIAKKIKNTFPIIFSIYPSVGRRFKTQLNENSKIQARWEVIPEAAHNEIEAFGGLNKNFSLIFLRDRLAEREEIKKSIEFLKKLGKNANVIEIFSKGETKLERILYLIWLTDFISYFLAIENKVNPTETFIIKKFKEFVYT